MAASNNLVGVSAGLQIGGVVGSLYSQYVNRKQAERAFKRNMARIRQATVRNLDALDDKQTIVNKQIKRSQFDIALKTIAAKGQARVKAAQIGVSSSGTEDILNSIELEESRQLSEIAIGTEQAFADIAAEVTAANQGLQNQLYGLNTQIPAVDYTAGLIQIGVAAIDYKQKTRE